MSSSSFAVLLRSGNSNLNLDLRVIGPRLAGGIFRHCKLGQFH